jgi:4-hydroxy-4-methyl-2-oxoglutarate aldolase
MMRRLRTKAKDIQCLQQNGAAFRRRFYASAATSDKRIENDMNLMDRLRQVDTTVLCDADKALHGPLSLQPHVQKYEKDRISLIHLRSIPTKQTLVMVGVARTVLLSDHDDFLGVVQGLLEAKPGEVLVVSSSASSESSNNPDRINDNDSRMRRAMAGDLLCTEAARMGLKGMVVDGGMRDTAFLAQLDNFRCYARSITPYAGTALHPAQDMQCHVFLGGATVRPKDVIVGDDDGLLVGSSLTFETILPLAMEIKSLEDQVRQGILRGRSLASMTNIQEHIQCRLQGKESKLEFRP